MTGTVITVAPTGAESKKVDVPALPVTLAELVTTAKECEALGASIIHVHIRDDDARPTLDQGRLRDTVAGLRESTGLIVQLSSGGSVHDPLTAASVSPECELTAAAIAAELAVPVGLAVGYWGLVADAER